MAEQAEQKERVPYLVSIKNPKLRYQVLELDEKTMMAKLKGTVGAEFTRDISKPELKKYGYKVEWGAPPQDKARPRKSAD